MAPKSTLRSQLAGYLRHQRGDLTIRDFARKVGVSSSSLQRLEQGEQNLTLDSLETLIKKLKVRLRDVFPE